MKKITVMLVVLIALCYLSACTQETYEDGYADGYADGFLDAKFEMEYLADEKFLDGYDIGYSDGQMDVEWLEYEAIHYARQYSEWSPEEAVSIIRAYQNNDPFWRDGSSPRNEEYLDAIESLIYFYDYFFCARYK